MPICHSVITFVIVRMPKTSACTPISDCRMIISLRLSTRSATTPAYGPSSSTGRVCRATTSPTSTADPVRWKTRNDWAIVCIQVPMSEVAWPKKYSR